MVLGVRRLGAGGELPDAGVGLLDHLLAEIDADQVVLVEVVVEHVLGGLAEVDDPLGDRRRLDAVGHVLGVDRAGRVIVAADAADPAGDEMRVARVLALHEDAVAAEDRRGGVALGDDPVGEVDLGVDAEAADDPGDRIPVHLDDLRRLALFVWSVRPAMAASPGTRGGSIARIAGVSFGWLWRHSAVVERRLVSLREPR